jgi:hypothetical protein
MSWQVTKLVRRYSVRQLLVSNHCVRVSNLRRCFYLQTQDFVVKHLFTFLVAKSISRIAHRCPWLSAVPYQLARRSVHCHRGRYATQRDLRWIRNRLQRADDWEADSRSTVQGVSRFLWILDVHRSLPVAPILNHLNPFQNLLNMKFNKPVCLPNLPVLAVSSPNLIFFDPTFVFRYYYHMFATCAVFLIILDLNTLIIFGDSINCEAFRY